MLVKTKKLAVPFRLIIVEDASVVKNLMEIEYNNNICEHVLVKGFRKGTVPREIAEKSPNFNKFSAYSKVFETVYKNAIEQEKLDVVGVNDLQVMGDFEYGKSLTLQGLIYLKPKVTFFDKFAVNVKKQETLVTQSMIEEQIELILNSKANFNNIIDENYVIKNGDILIIDYEGKIDNKLFNGGSAKNFKYVVGETRFIEGFEQQLLKLKINETSIVNVDFPESYHEKSLRNKNANFTVIINKISSKVPKTIEEVAIENNQSINDFQLQVTEKLIEDHKSIDEEKFIAQVLNKALSIAEIEPLPESMIEHELATEWNNLLYRMGTTEEEFIKKNKMGKDVFYHQKRSKIEKELTEKIFLDYLCEINNVTVSEEEVNDYVNNRLLKFYKTDEEKIEIKENLKKKHNYAAAEASVKHEKALDLLFK